MKLYKNKQQEERVRNNKVITMYVQKVLLLEAEVKELKYQLQKRGGPAGAAAASLGKRGPKSQAIPVLSFGDQQLLGIL